MMMTFFFLCLLLVQSPAMLVVQAMAAQSTITNMWETIQSMMTAFDHHVPPTAAYLLTKNMRVNAKGYITDEKDQANLELVENFNMATMKLAASCIADLGPELRHNTMHCLTWGYSLKHVCGFELKEFSKLFVLMLPALIVAFPNSPLIDGPDDDLSHAALRFKFFLTLYFLRTGT
jgi:hypothetical protein